MSPDKVNEPALRFVKVNAPLTIPLKTPGPPVKSTPIMLLEANTMLFVSVAAPPPERNLKAPLDTIPFPFKVIVFVLPKVPLNAIFKAAPLETVVPLVSPKPPVAPIFNRPALTVVEPL